MAQARDADLVDRVAENRDRRAFAELWRRHTPRLYQLELRLTGRVVEDAEDLVQETWFRAARGLSTFQRDRNFGAWLRGIGVNVAREWLRRQSGVDARISDFDVLDLPAPLESFADHLDLDAAIDGLPAGYRAVFVLHDIEGYTHDEIGAALAIAPGTSKSQLSAARRALRRRLQPPHPVEESVDERTRR